MTFNFLNSVSKIPFLGKLDPEINFGTQVFIINSTIVLLNSVHKISLFDKFGPETWKCFVVNRTRYNGIFKGTDSELDKYFLKFSP